MQIRNSFGRSLRSLFVKPLKAAVRRIVRWVAFKARFAVMFLCFYSYLASTSAYIVAKLRIPDLLRDGPKSVGELAELTGADESILYRIMRALAGINIFDEVGDRTFALTPLGEMLQSERTDTIYYWALHFGDDILPALPWMLNQTKTGEHPFIKAHGMPLWDYLSADDARSEMFDKTMNVFNVQHVPSIVKAFDFSSVGTLADCGGGRGRLIIEILKANPTVRGILFDRPEVTPEAQQRIDEAGLSDRCQAISGSFLESVPAEADAYIFKHVFHDWDDESVLRVLQNCRAAMDDGDRLFIVEGFVDHDLFGLDSFRRFSDIYEMVLLPGKERSLDAMRELLGEAGFEMRSLTPTSIVDVAILESVAIPRDEPAFVPA